MWGVAHGALWALLALVLGFVEFVDVWKAVAFGAVIGIGHSVLQWSTTSLSVEDGTLVSRNFTWVRRVPISEIELVQRARHRRWSGVVVRLRDGDEIVLAAPVSSVMNPNPEFDEELRRLCASIVLGDSEHDPDPEQDPDRRWDD